MLFMMHLDAGNIRNGTHQQMVFSPEFDQTDACNELGSQLNLARKPWAERPEWENRQIDPHPCVQRSSYFANHAWTNKTKIEQW